MGPTGERLRDRYDNAYTGVYIEKMNRYRYSEPYNRALTKLQLINQYVRYIVNKQGFICEMILGEIWVWIVVWPGSKMF